eukprot:TRINITY_DN25952_c0_g1_i1.p1 TRINITY_DN25952_c0_g1~~TRINITY_DN25952_c0_g1_i1.p1  ORF type:complete len:181 (-),score=37.89 TRINITY_DN25952_c0_g1_i1:97-639(-)
MTTKKEKRETSTESTSSTQSTRTKSSSSKKEKSSKSKSSNPPLLQLAEQAADRFFTTKNCEESYTNKQLVSDVLESMEVLEKFLDYWTLKHFFVPMLIYVDRYVAQVGKLGPVHIFDILCVACVVTVKVWEDKWITNTTFAKMFAITKEELNINERNFLNALDYDLSVTNEEVLEFLSST